MFQLNSDRHSIEKLAAQVSSRLGGDGLGYPGGDEEELANVLYDVLSENDQTRPMATEPGS